MSIIKFDETTAYDLCMSADEFPVDFDAAWQWLGYSRKDNAKRVLESAFKYGTEFSSTLRKTSEAGRPSESIKLTVVCFKKWAMMANTAKGNEVRDYFIEAEARVSKLARENMYLVRSIARSRIDYEILDEQFTKYRAAIATQTTHQPTEQLAFSVLGRKLETNELRSLSAWLNRCGYDPIKPPRVNHYTGVAEINEAIRIWDSSRKQLPPAK